MSLLFNFFLKSASTNVLKTGQTGSTMNRLSNQVWIELKLGFELNCQNPRKGKTGYLG